MASCGSITIRNRCRTGSATPTRRSTRSLRRCAPRPIWQGATRWRGTSRRSCSTTPRCCGCRTPPYSPMPTPRGCGGWIPSARATSRRACSSRPGKGAMLAYALRRAVAAVAALFGTTVVVFLLLRVIPGDPATAVLLTMLDPGAGSAELSRADIEALRAELGLSGPLPVQYLEWLGEILRGNLGTSLRSRQPILGELAARIPGTLTLAAASLGVMLAIALPCGVLGALHAGRSADHLSRALSLLGESLPNFFLGVLLVYLFALWLRWLPSMGWQGPESVVLPALTLGTGIAATTTRLLRASLLDTLSQPFMLMAEAKGLSRRRLLFRHALRPALIPVLTASSLVLGGLLGGAVVVETVFAWPGVGRYMIEAIAGRDYPVIQGFSLFMATLFIALNFVVDILYRLLDPRIRVEVRRHG
ncbi:MAG: ABC transporter permease [Chromatiaceae bacterium]|nr:MAG: ABC transporter permease [Chromatiaceae bacterium]